MTSELLLRVMLVVLAVYHVGMGVVAAAAPPAAARLAGWLYALDAGDRPAVQVRYGVRMLGLYALALGALLSAAAWRPREYVAVIMVAAGLQLARALTRLTFGGELRGAFGISAGRNIMNAGLLMAEAAVLVAGLLLLA